MKNAIYVNVCMYVCMTYIPIYQTLTLPRMRFYTTAAWPPLDYELHIMYCKIKINNYTLRKSHNYIRRVN